MKALICIVAFLAQGVCLAAQMPKWVPSRHDVDDGTNVLVRLAVPFDIGTTCDKPEYGRPGKERTTGSCVEIVPAALYSFAKVICTISDDPACERTFVMRLTRYIDGPGWNNGRTYEAMCDTLVDFDAAEKRRVGDKWEVSFPVDMGMIEDLVHGDDRGTFCGKFGRYLDVDFLSRTIARRNPSADTRMMPDASHRSAVTVHGFVLERSSLDIEPKFVRPGNVFAAGERPGMKFRCTALRPGKHRMEWTICDAEGKSLKTGSAALPDDGETAVDLDVGRDGWHRVDFTVFDGSRVLLTHRASYVLLPPDTRTE